MKKSLVLSLVILFLLMLFGSAHAALTTIGTAQFGGAGDHYNLIWDDDNNGNSLVWLDYTNARTNWTAQNAWAAGLDSALTLSLNAGVSVTWDGSWRLPNAAGGFGYNKTESEMGHLYYNELGNSASAGGGGLQNTGDFDNLVASWYWSGTEYADDPDRAWVFDMGHGGQVNNPKSTNDYGLAVRSGQVSTSAVPVPGAIFLLGSGLVGLAGFSRRRKGNRC